jgi:hypothetical protein
MDPTTSAAAAPAKAKVLIILDSIDFDPNRAVENRRWLGSVPINLEFECGEVA